MIQPDELMQLIEDSRTTCMCQNLRSRMTRGRIVMFEVLRQLRKRRPESSKKTGDESDLGEFEGEDIYEGATRGFWIKGSPDRHNLYRMIETAQTERKQFRDFEEAFEESDGEESDYDAENLGTQTASNQIRQLVTRRRGSEGGAAEVAQLVLKKGSNRDKGEHNFEDRGAPCKGAMPLCTSVVEQNLDERLSPCTSGVPPCTTYMGDLDGETLTMESSVKRIPPGGECVRNRGRVPCSGGQWFRGRPPGARH